MGQEKASRGLSVVTKRAMFSGEERTCAYSSLTVQSHSQGGIAIGLLGKIPISAPSLVSGLMHQRDVSGSHMWWCCSCNSHHTFCKVLGIYI